MTTQPRARWRQKLDFLLVEQAKASDPEQKFQIHTAIEEAQAMLAELEEGGPNAAPPVDLVTPPAGAAKWDLFISHAEQPDGTRAAALCDALEARGLSCFLAKRRVQPGEDWPSALARAIPRCRGLVVLLSVAGLGSTFVKREVERADNERIPLFPVRLEPLSLDPGLALFLSLTQCFDVAPRTWDQALPDLVERLCQWSAAQGARPRDLDGGADPDRDALVRLLGVAAMRLLANPGTAELRRLGGFPQRAAALAGKPARERFQPLIVDLYQATERCLTAWRTSGGVPPRFKSDCHALLGELLKGAVERDGHTPEELAEIVAATPDRMFVACRRAGTAATVYCALTDIPLRLAERRPGDSDIGGGSAISLDGLAQGLGRDAQRDAFAAVWLAVKGAEPADFDRDDCVEDLADALDMERTAFGRDPLFLVARGPREWLHGDGLAGAAERLRIGLVIHRADSDYAYLACEERRLVNLVCKYLQLLDKA